MTTKAHQRYRNKQGTVVPGVTTVLNILNKPALVYWAWNLGMKGLDFRKVTDQAASIGTIAHYLVECYLKGQEPDLGDYTPNNIRPARLAFGAFEEWWTTQSLTVIGSEEQLASDKFQYGGTIDIMAQGATKGDIRLIDVKTSKAIYDEMLMQLAAYRQIWDENNPDRPVTSCHIIRLGKEDGSFSLHNYGRLDYELDLFKHLLAFYTLQRDKDPKRRKDKVMADPRADNKHP